MPQVAPEDDKAEAWLVALLPQKFGKESRAELYDRGYNVFSDNNGETYAEPFVDALEEFALTAFKRPSLSEVRADPVHKDPGVLTMAATLSALIVEGHEEYADATRGYFNPDMKLKEYLEQLWVHHVHWILTVHDERAGYMQEIAEVAYARDKEDDLGPPPGRVCTGVKRMAEFGRDVYVEVPVEHLNHKCLARNEDGDIVTKVKYGNAYIPAWDLDEKIEDMAERAFTAHVNTQRELLPQKQQAWAIKHTDGIKSEIDRLLEAKQYDLLFSGEDYPKKLGVVMNAIRDYDYDDVNFGEWVTAKQIYEAINDYYPHLTERAIVDSISSPLSMSKVLVEYEDHPDVEVRRPEQKRKSNKYKIHDSQKEFNNVEVQSPEDILELPCMENVDEYLQEQKPTRWMLNSIGHVLMSLKNDFGKEELVDFYRRYPWFDEEITRHQLNYERDQRVADGNPPNPVGCDNDNQNFDTFCIGRENCSYSIYNSLPMRDDVIDQVKTYQE